MKKYYCFKLVDGRTLRATNYTSGSIATTLDDPEWYENYFGFKPAMDYDEKPLKHMLVYNHRIAFQYEKIEKEPDTN